MRSWQDRARRPAAPLRAWLAIGASPDPHTYLRTVEMVQRIAETLAAAGLPPADRWDVHDVMAAAPAPKAIALIRH
ncbi:MAG: hypothetical protein IPL61_18160 [Myxococcales bacterium]|nr:hypothetical protein [Myxococcales bacterium]